MKRLEPAKAKSIPTTRRMRGRGARTLCIGALVSGFKFNHDNLGFL